MDIKKRIDKILSVPDAGYWVLFLPEASSGKISVVKKIDYSNQDCVDYALGISSRNCHGADCINLFPEITEPQEGDIALYRGRGRLRHAGIYQKDTTITSRWGRGGPIFNHPIDFVPEAYGDSVTFRRISR